MPEVKEQISVNLTAKSSKALRETMEATGDTKTDCVNRAVQIAAYIEAVWSAGGNVLVQERPGEDARILKAF